MGIFDIFTKREKKTAPPICLEMAAYAVPQPERPSPPPGKEKECPYCQKTLEKKITRKVECPHCGKTIYLRHGWPVTEEQKTKHDDLDMFRFKEEEYDIKQTGLLKKFGRMPSHSDIMWGLANGRIPVLLKNAAYADLGDLYLAMAKHQHSRGKDFVELYGESHKIGLRSSGAIKVYIQTCGAACPPCQTYEGKTISMDEALSTMPIPNKGCYNRIRREFLRCFYWPLSNDEDMHFMEKLERKQMGDEVYEKHQVQKKRGYEQSARLTFARHLESSGKSDEAVAISEQLAAEGSVHTSVYRELASIYRQAKRYDDEIRVIEQFLQFWREADYWEATYKDESMITQYTERLNKAKALKAKANKQKAKSGG